MRMVLGYGRGGEIVNRGLGSTKNSFRKQRGTWVVFEQVKPVSGLGAASPQPTSSLTP